MAPLMLGTPESLVATLAVDDAGALVPPWLLFGDTIGHFVDDFDGPLAVPVPNIVLII